MDALLLRTGCGPLWLLVAVLGVPPTSAHPVTITCDGVGNIRPYGSRHR